MTPAVSISGLTKRFGGVEAVRALSLTIAPGEIFGLIGPNGAGKTTALECLLGLQEPDAGDISLFGVDLRRHPNAAKRLVGAQLQVSALPDAMSSRQALRLTGSFYAQPVPPDELLERFGLADRADARYASLSAGLRQRLALALAFVNRPRLVVLDEPTAALDPPARRELHALIASERAAGCSVLFTTHQLEEAHQLCDRIALIDRGRLLALGTPEGLLARSSARPRLGVRTDPPIPEFLVKQLPGVAACSPEGSGWSLATDDVAATLAAFVALAAARQADVADLRLERPTLEDVFIELTSDAAAAAGEPPADANRRRIGVAS